MFWVSKGLIIVIDHKQTNFYLRRILIYIKVEAQSKSFKRAASFFYVVIVAIKQWATESKIFQHYSVEDNELIGSLRSVKNSVPKHSQRSELNEVTTFIILEE